MLNEEDAIRALVYDNVNVTEENPMKELMKVLFQVFIYVVIAYFSIFFLTGIVLHNMSDSQQVWLENAIADTSFVETLKLTDTEKERLIRVRDEILQRDSDFPKTSALDIEIIEHPMKNSLCYPNGNIYITDSLYKYLTTDEMLTFVIAHEMAHYKNRDHLMNLRKNIASNCVILSFAILGGDVPIDKLVSSSLDLADMKYSKRKEALADKYAARILKRIYGNLDGGIQVIEILKQGDYDESDFFSTHPSLEKRIMYLKKNN